MMKSSINKLSYLNIVVLGLFVVVLFYYLNYTPERTFVKLKCLEVVFLDTPIVMPNSTLEWEVDKYNREKKWQKSFDSLLTSTHIVNFSLTPSNTLNTILLSKAQLVVRSMQKMKLYSTIVKISFNEKVTYEQFIRCQNIAMLERVNCYMMMEYDFYFFYCE